MLSVKSKPSDRKLLLFLGGGMVAILIGVGFLARTTEDSDQRPSSTNSGSAGTKGAFLALQELGTNVSRWNEPLAGLSRVPAEKTTLLLLQPTFSMQNRKSAAAALQAFMERGGHVLLTGAPWASLLPGGDVQQPGTFAPKLCYSTPEGPGPLAAAGEVEMRFDGGWKAEGPQFRVEQRCLHQAIVVRFPVGKGEAIWWSSSTPISNAGLRVEGNLKLVLASLGPGRQVLFDEYVQELHGDNEHLLRGLPLWWMLAQSAAAFVLLVLSFSRRKGPVRLPVELPRSSPLEFATSMGDLYAKAGATVAATEAAKRRLIRTLQREAGVGRATLNEGPDAIADTLRIRLGGEWNKVADDLRAAEAARSEPLNAKSALVLVQALGADDRRVRTALRPRIHGAAVLEASSDDNRLVAVNEEKG